MLFFGAIFLKTIASNRQAIATRGIYAIFKGNGSVNYIYEINGLGRMHGESEWVIVRQSVTVFFLTELMRECMR
jgi:hypothetical protein